MANKKTKKDTPKKYIVLQDFADLQDGGKVYHKGGSFPIPANKNIDSDRIKELTSSKNSQGRPVIKEVEEDQE